MAIIFSSYSFRYLRYGISTSTLDFGLWTSATAFLDSVAAGSLWAMDDISYELFVAIGKTVLPMVFDDI